VNSLFEHFVFPLLFKFDLKFMVKFKGIEFFIAMDQKMCFIAIVLKMHLLSFNQTKTKMIFFKTSFPKATKLPLKAI